MVAVHQTQSAYVTTVIYVVRHITKILTRRHKHYALANARTFILGRGIARSSTGGAEGAAAAFREDVQTRCGFFFMRMGTF